MNLNFLININLYILIFVYLSVAVTSYQLFSAYIKIIRIHLKILYIVTIVNVFYLAVFPLFLLPHDLNLSTLKKNIKKKKILGFPGGTVVKNPPANAGDMGSTPGPGRSHMPRSN